MPARRAATSWKRPPPPSGPLSTTPSAAEIGAVLAAVAALGFGSGDYLGGRATRRVPVGQVLAWGHLVGLAAAIAWVVVDQASAGPEDLVGGALAGLFGLAGLAFLYSGLASGRAAVVAPTAALVGAVIPVGFGLLVGEAVSALGWIGVALGMPAIWLVSAQGGQPRRASGLAHGVWAGVFFGGYFVALAGVGETSGLWPLVSSRALSTLLLFAVAVVAGNGWARVPDGGTARLVVGVGIFDLVGNIGYLVASRLSPIVLVAVVASLYPAVTVVLARLFDREALGAFQIVGLALGLLSMALVSLG